MKVKEHFTKYLPHILRPLIDYLNSQDGSNGQEQEDCEEFDSEGELETIVDFLHSLTLNYPAFCYAWSKELSKIFLRLISY